MNISQKRGEGLGSHYFSRSRAQPGRFGKVTLYFREHEIDLLTAPGVFSYRRVDKGTALLIDLMEIPQGGLVLDLGCGYGALAVCASLMGARVVGVDINDTATWLARRNLCSHAQSPWIVVLGDLYSPFRGCFDAVLCNPPVRTGRGRLKRIVELAPKYLREAGSLQLVISAKMGARILSSLMEASFGNVEEAGRRSGYRVLIGRRRGGRVD